MEGGELLDGRYRLERLLGRGGSGAVYHAHDIKLERPVAVKVIPSRLTGNPEAESRFRRQLSIVSRLQHPGLVPIFDSGILADGRAYVVMELVRGEDLREVLRREGCMEPARAARILSRICVAIETAHRQGVLHRDLKPENILLSTSDGEPRVVDFGLADVIAVDRRDAVPTAADASGMPTLDATVVGTPAYMAPEELRGETPDARTDVFSLGVIAYEMLTGTLPFGRGSTADVVLAQARGIGPGAIEVLPPPLARAVRGALEPDRDRRPPSAQAFAHLINAASGATW
jgi:serine/threonine-protein kinase